RQKRFVAMPRAVDATRACVLAACLLPLASYEENGGGEAGRVPFHAAQALPGSRDALFGDDSPKDAAAKGAASTKPPAAPDPTGGCRGHVQTAFAYTDGNPEHWSKARGRLELGPQ